MVPGAQPAEPGRPPIPRRNVIGGLVIGLPASALFLYLATRGLDPGEVANVVRQTSLGWVVLAAASMGIVYAAQALRWRRIAHAAGMDLPWHSFLRMVICGVAVNNVVPGRPGEILRGYWLAQESGAPAARAFSTVIVDRVSDVFVLVAGLLISYPFVPHPSWLRDLVMAALAVSVAIAFVLFACRFWVRHRARGGRTVPDWVRSHWLGQQLSRLVRGAAATVNGRVALVITGLSVLAWSGFVLSAWLIARALGIEVTPVELVFVTAVVNLGVAIPSSPGFIGTYQWLCVSALGLFGVGRPEAFAFSVLLQAVWFIPTTLAGFVLLAMRASRWRSSRRVATPGTGTQAVRP
ncbi:MAG: flippase-like domain-containing protein [Chloroflexota bacterium]|nr:flippase-like domain-containing protein [Chloroflexota bacterium]